MEHAGDQEWIHCTVGFLDSLHCRVFMIIVYCLHNILFRKHFHLACVSMAKWRELNVCPTLAIFPSPEHLCKVLWFDVSFIAH